MSDSDLVFMFTENVNVFQMVFVNYMTMLSAFLVAGYLVAAKLKPSMVFIVVALFTGAALQQMLSVIGIQGDIGRIAQEIVARTDNGSSDIAWHGAVQVHPSMIFVLNFNPLVVVILGYIGALTFFFHQRHIGRTQ